MSTETIESRSPQRPDDVVVTTQAADRAAVADTFAAARGAQADWGGQPALARANALEDAAGRIAGVQGELADLMVREVGKPITEAKGEVLRAVGILRFHAQAALDADGETHPAVPPAPSGTLLMSRRRPHGVTGLITPWNFPLAIPLWKAAPALAFGNAVVLKPAPQATAVALRLARAPALPPRLAGVLGGSVPDGVFTVVPGDVETGRSLVDASDVVSFTGSTTA